MSTTELRYADSYEGACKLEGGDTSDPRHWVMRGSCAAEDVGELPLVQIDLQIREGVLTVTIHDQPNPTSISYAIKCPSTPVGTAGPDPEQLSFERFPTAKIFKGPTRFPDFHGRDREFVDFRTRIKEGLREGPNFAGHYSVIQFGCGTRCTLVYIADNKTGKVVRFPRGGDDNVLLQLAYKPNSRLLIAQWANEKEDKCVVEWFEWQNDTAKLLDAMVIGKIDICFTRDLISIQ